MEEKKVGMERGDGEKRCVCITFEVFGGLFLSAGDLRGSWVWCLSRQQASLEALGRLWRGWSCQARREGAGFGPLSPVLPPAPWGTVLSWLVSHLRHLSFRCYFTQDLSPPHNPDPLPMGVLLAMVLYKKPNTSFFSHQLQEAE